ncbi:MAG: hypothetical protein JW737_03070 [Acidobacteria bacterium]|nr:hypothetical protein [Acidobacteriota bacterium]
MQNDLTIVFMTDKPYEAEIVKGLLTEYGIEAHLISTGHERDMLYPVTKLFEPLPEKHYHIYVRKEDEQLAKEIIEAPLPSDDEEWYYGEA